MIDIENSSIHLLGEKTVGEQMFNQYSFQKKSLILTKECRSEIISSSNPLISQTEISYGFN